MDFLEKMQEVAAAERIVEVEDRAKGAMARGDFEGSVLGYWERLDQTGVGIVTYKGKEYKTKPIGFHSTSKGTTVELTHANGIYFSKF
jgi:hypothetical protein|tara:strand:- start:746 stop:1009 length:264 start_codon:yes stop_codon:yes gene_type:complete